MGDRHAELRIAAAQGLGPISRALRRGGLALRLEGLGGDTLGLVVSDERNDVVVTFDEEPCCGHVGTCVLSVERDGAVLEGVARVLVRSVAVALRHALRR
jgi:hypothetical protein